jgi:hypothetical protein
MLGQLFLYARLFKSSPDQTHLRKLTNKLVYRPQRSEEAKI